MERLISLLTDPIFWFATVFVGFLLSIGANFATDGIKRYWGNFSASQRAKNDAEDKYIETEAAKCYAEPAYLTLRTALLSYYQGKANGMTLFGLLVFLASGMSLVYGDSVRESAVSAGVIPLTLVWWNNIFPQGLPAPEFYTGDTFRIMGLLGIAFSYYVAYRVSRVASKRRRAYSIIMLVEQRMGASIAPKDGDRDIVGPTSNVPGAPSN